MHTIISNVKPSCLSEYQMHECYTLMCKYYKNISYDNFKRDLIEKDQIFLVKSGIKPLIGLSTIISKESSCGRFLFSFSGDTVIEKEYWSKSKLPQHIFQYVKSLSSCKLDHYYAILSMHPRTFFLIQSLFGNFISPISSTSLKCGHNYQEIATSFAETFNHFNYKFFQGSLICTSEYRNSELIIESRDVKKNSERFIAYEKANPNWRSGDELIAFSRITPQIKY